MAFKTITVKEKVYEKLKRGKRQGESFSDFFDRIAQSGKMNLLKYAGIWELAEGQAKSMKEEIRKNRQRKDERALRDDNT